MWTRVEFLGNEHAWSFPLPSIHWTNSGRIWNSTLQDDGKVLAHEAQEQGVPWDKRSKRNWPINNVGVFCVQRFIHSFFIHSCILQLDLADKLGCSLPKAGLLLIYSINALYHVVNDGLNKDLTVGEIVKLQDIFKDLFVGVDFDCWFHIAEPENLKHCKVIAGCLHWKSNYSICPADRLV